MPRDTSPKAAMEKSSNPSFRVPEEVKDAKASARGTAERSFSVLQDTPTVLSEGWKEDSKLCFLLSLTLHSLHWVGKRPSEVILAETAPTRATPPCFTLL